jgi:hypothetical protein
MNGKLAKDLTLDEAKKAVNNIIEIINEFLCSIEQAIPHQGYGRLASSLVKLNSDVQKCSGPFLKTATVDDFIQTLFTTFTRMHPNIEKNLQDMFEAQKEIILFLEQHNKPFEYKNLDFDDDIINKMKDVTMYTNQILPKLKQSNYSDMTGINALLLNHSSRVETVVKAFLEELTKYRDKINQYAKTQNIPYTVKYDPVKIMGVRGTVLRNNGKHYTEATAIRHLIDHHHFKINQNPCTIHFKSPPKGWEFTYDKTFTCEDFYNFVAEIDTFCKAAVNLLFSIQLLGVLRQKFVI